MDFTEDEMVALQNYLSKKLGNKEIKIMRRKNSKESLDVLIGNEFIGTLYKDCDEGEVSYDFNMAILDMDLQSTH